MSKTRVAEAAADTLVDQFEILSREDQKHFLVTFHAIEAAYVEWRAVVGHRSAYEWLCTLTRLDSFKPPPRSKTVHDAAYNLALLKAAEEAPRGHQTRALREVAERFCKTNTTAESRVRHLRRLKKRPLTRAEQRVQLLNQALEPAAKGDK
jgi:hypothetical protein